MSLGPRIASFVHRSARVSSLLALGLLSLAWAQTGTLPDGMRYVMTGAMEVMGGVASGPSLTAVPVSRDDEGAWTYVGDLDAALRGQPSAQPDAACLIHFGARVSSPGAGGEPDPIIEFSGVIPGGLQENAIYPIALPAEPPEGGSWGLYGREWAQPGTFLLRVADLVPSDRGPVYTLFRGALGTVTVVGASAERTELAFSASLVQVSPPVDDDADASDRGALQLAGTFAQANRASAIEVAGSVGALAGEVSGDWYLCGGAPSTEQLARAVEGQTPEARTPQAADAGAPRAGVGPESATTASTEVEMNDPEPLGPATRSQTRTQAPAAVEPDAAPSDVPDLAAAAAPAPAADAAASAEDAEAPALLAIDPSLPATCGGMPQHAWAGLISGDAENLAVETEGESCRISFERPDPEQDARWWRRSGISHVALPNDDGSIRFQVYGDGLRGEGTQQPGPPQRFAWTVEAR